MANAALDCRARATWLTRVYGFPTALKKDVKQHSSGRTIHIQWLSGMVDVTCWFGAVVLVVLVEWTQGVGIKRRLEEAGFGDEGLGEPSSSSITICSERLQGGVRQRLQGGQAEKCGRSGPLYDSLKKKWAIGKVNSKEVLEFAQGAAAQGARGLEDMASLGGHNAFRSLKKVFGAPAGAPNLHWLEIPTKTGLKTPHPFLMPHELFASYHKERKEEWVNTSAGPANACLDFWKSMRGSKFVDLHPSLPAKHWKSIIPVGIHGDAGAFSHADSLYTISWNSLVGEGSTAKKKVRVYCVQEVGDGRRHVGCCIPHSGMEPERHAGG